MGCCQARPNVSNAITTINEKPKTKKEEQRSSVVSTKKNSKVCEEGQDFQSTQIKETRGSQIVTQNKGIKSDLKHIEESIDKATKDDIAKEIKKEEKVIKTTIDTKQTQIEDKKVKIEEKKAKIEEKKVQIEEKKDKLKDIEDISIGKMKSKVDAIPKIIPKEPIKYEITSEGGSQKNSGNDIHKFDEQGSIPALSGDRGINKPSSPIVLPPIIEKMNALHHMEESKVDPIINKKTVEPQQSSRNIKNNDPTETSMCISAVVHEYVGDVFEYVMDSHRDEFPEESIKFIERQESKEIALPDDEKSYEIDQKELNKSIESTSTIRKVAKNYVNDMFEYMIEEEI